MGSGCHNFEQTNFMKLTCILLIFLLGNVIAQNLILNPGFELGTPAYNTTIAPASLPSLVGLWEFNNTSFPLTATVGSNLTLVGSHSTIAGYGGPDNAIRIGVGSHYNVNNPIGANGGGAFTNRYTLLFDFRINASAIWRTFYQTNTANTNDGELFCRNTDGLIGVGSYSVEGAIANTWHRLIVSVRNGGGGSFEVYLDGRRVLSLGAQANDGRWSLGTTLKIFADDSGDDGLMDVSTVALFNTNLTQLEMEALGRWTCNNWTGMGNYQQQLRNGGYPSAHSGTHYCYAGSDANLTAEQTVDVSSLATQIDAGSGIFTFSCWMQTFTQSPQDQARVIVEYRNAALTVLSTYDTGNQTTSSSWVQFNDIRTAPVGTRNVRIRIVSTKNNGTSNDAYYDDFSLTFNSPLPVELLDFDGNSMDNSVKLKWSTAAEINSSHYVIERSDDMIFWKEIGSIRAIGNSNIQSDYELIDNAPKQINYYRLVQFDLNNNSEFFGPIVISYDSSFPRIFLLNNLINIVNTKFTLFEIFDLNGKLIQSGPLVEDQCIMVDRSTLVHGIYLFVLKNDSEQFVKKICIN